MGDLNNIQDEIYAEMSGDLADVSYPYTGTRKIQGAFDPENPTAGTTQAYTWSGIFGLSFTVRDTETFKIEAQDQKGIVFMRNGAEQIPFEPRIDEVVTVRGQDFIIVDMVKIPADNGWTLQMRKYG